MTLNTKINFFLVKFRRHKSLVIIGFILKKKKRKIQRFDEFLNLEIEEFFFFFENNQINLRLN